MDAKTRDEEANKGKKESLGEAGRKKLTDKLTPDFVKKISKALEGKEK